MQGKTTRLRILFKRTVFFLLRFRHRVVFYSGRQPSSGINLKVCLVGNRKRARYFIEQLYGYLPEYRVAGKCTAIRNPLEVSKHFEDCDLLLVEINRMVSGRYQKNGYFTLPQWIEFGRNVENTGEKRYLGATRSLKSDLNRIEKSGLTAFISKSSDDFEHFYEKMYLPFVSKRFGADVIIKPKKTLKKHFRKGFLLLLKDGSAAIAGALISQTERTASEVAIGVLNGSEERLKQGVSGSLDYHFHEWAREKGKAFINVGHTRPFPHDGVYFNKRKWMMDIMHDADGVMDMALKPLSDDKKTSKILRNSPFIFHYLNDLFLFYSTGEDENVDKKAVEEVMKRYWTKGLKRIVYFWPAGEMKTGIDAIRRICPEDLLPIHSIGQYGDLKEMLKESF